MADEQYKYDAFLSYNRAADELTVPELQRLIRRVGQRWYSRATLRSAATRPTSRCRTA